MSTAYDRGMPHGLMFHRFRASGQPAEWQGALTPEDVDSILRFVGPENVLAPSEWTARLEAGRLRPSDLCVTFDDGLQCQVDYALPVLDRYGIKAFWFVYTCVFHGEPVRSEIYSYVAGLMGGMDALSATFLARCSPEMTAQLGSDAFREYDAAIRVAAPFYSASDIAFRFLRNRPENRQAFEALMDRIIEEAGFEIQELSRTLWLSADTLSDLTSQGHQVGLHSYDHPYEMATLTTEQQRSQYERNAADIKVATGRTPTSASHPLDSYDERTLALLERMGIRCGFRANMIAAGSSATANRRLEIPREDSSTLLLMAAGTTA